MTDKSYTFASYTQDGELIAEANGRESAYSRVISKLMAYRDRVKRASGTLYGNPSSMGWYTVNDIKGALGPSAYLMGAHDEIARLDRIGLARVVEIQAETAAEEAARHG